MRILGIDPGLRTTGFGVLDAEGPRLCYVASGVIQTGSAAQGNLPARLKLLFDGITELQARYTPDVAAVEIVFVNVNPQATLLLGQARGACVTALVASDLPVAEYTALQMKQAVAGHGKAAKTQVQAMVQRLLQPARRPAPRRRRRPGPGHHARPREGVDGETGCGDTACQRNHQRHVPQAGAAIE
jgi:crossover junction endodeoxyribonuclease RuvC